MNYKEQIEDLGIIIETKGQFLRKMSKAGVKRAVILKKWDEISEGMPFVLFDGEGYVSFNVLLEKGYVQPNLDIEEAIDKKCSEYFDIKIKESQSKNNPRYDRLKSLLEHETFDKVYVIATKRELYKLFLHNSGLKPNEAILIEDTIHFNAVDFKGSLIILLGEWHHSRVFKNVSNLERLKKCITFTIGEV